LLLAMVILTLITTLAAGMVWQQWRAIQVEAAERARAQAAWILTGALDWARLILREDARPGSASSNVDHLGEPWAVPLAEARLSTFLAADANSNADSEGIDAFLAGAIEDAQSRYNLRRLTTTTDPKQLESEIAVLQRLCEIAGASASTASVIANGLRSAAKGEAESPLPPNTVDQLAWLGVDAATLQRLKPYVTLLPNTTPININTAPREVIAAVLAIDVGSAERIVTARQRDAFKSPDAALKLVANAQQPISASVDVKTSYFEVQGRIRIGDRVLQERSLVVRNGLDVSVLRRERVNLLAGER
jgi:general secretion pathway protein K